ncbi:MAG: ADOP family duplicated permease [Vicinamibacteria bacterium]|nr:ADOP family duplicated permease [Vicinamibacteria bacterium]
MATWRGLSGWWRQRTAFDEAREELRFHVEMLVEEKRRAGVPEAEARREARLELGEVEPCAEQLADGRPGATLEAIRRDARMALRRLRHAPAFSLAVIALVALGVGASTAMFTLVDQVLLRPLPFPAPERLVRLFETSPGRGVAQTGVARGNLATWRAQARSFEQLALGYATGRTIAGGGSEAEVLLTGQVSCDFFPLLGVAVRHGRTFDAEECRRATYSSAAAPTGADPVIVLGHGLWQRRFGGDPGVVGRTVSLERRTFRVIGVLAAPLDLPEPGVEAFLPWELEGAMPHDQRYTVALGRLRAGVTPEASKSELAAIAADLARQRPQTNAGWSVDVAPLQPHATAAARPALLALLAGSVLLLAIACGNAALLFLARASARGPEAALRLALGASRVRVLREGLLETLIPCAAGGLAGLLLAAALLAIVPQAWPDLPRAVALQLDTRAAAFALAATLGSALVAGLWPAWRATRQDPRRALDTAQRVVGGRERGVRGGLVVAEVALTVALLTGAGLLLRSVRSLESTSPGFQAEGVLVAPVFLDSQEYATGERSRQYYAQLLERLRALPGVLAAGAATRLPASPVGPDFARPVWPAGEAGTTAPKTEAWVRMLTPGYLETLQVPVVAGRAFDATDTPDSRPVVAVNQSLARRLWPAGDAVGRTLVVDYSTAGTYSYEVVGVYADVRFRGPRSEPLDELFLPHAQRSYLIMNVTLRTAAGAPPMAEAVRQVFRAVDAQQPPQAMHRLEDLLGATFVRERRAMQLAVGFGVAASTLCALGLYGLLAYGVDGRRRELAVRAALGAGRARLMRLVAGEATTLVALGLALGALATAATAPALASLLHGVGPADPVTAAGVLAALALVALAASAVPAWRAASLDPARELRRD